ncbi:hypothetical protein [Paracraurococcus lichenis]|uniref:Uncharacterized protein n=1 Tax=Paracraurococcus lichenis TaxID=3064888 RepID=A0ABT9E391_9PROT|nr:hypothetical protein [Paracraurococcus sp. LOR1-02]MDO9710634.1 hypothetical protein [Paracraurococcus sp. LOR1-02]
MRRRGLLAALALALAALPAGAQQVGRGGRKPPPLELPKQPAVPPPSMKGGQVPNSSAAPVPDRSREGPKVVEQDRTRLNPSIINRSMPGRGQVDQGSPDLLEDKLFKPAPGVRLQAPFSY